MLKLVYILAALLLISCIEIPYLKRTKDKIERKYYIGFAVIGISLVTMKMMDMYLPNPLKFIEILYAPLSDGVFHILS